MHLLVSEQYIQYTFVYWFEVAVTSTRHTMFKCKILLKVYMLLSLLLLLLLLLVSLPHLI